MARLDAAICDYAMYDPQTYISQVEEAMIAIGNILLEQKLKPNVFGRPVINVNPITTANETWRRL